MSSEQSRRLVDAICGSPKCGRIYKVRPRDLDRGTQRRFCSRSCRYDVLHGERWKGGPEMLGGYLKLRGGMPAHVTIAERAIGRALPSGAEVHHVNGNKVDNRPSNLVICQDSAYHNLLHALTRVQKLGGRPFADKVCSRCKTPKPFTAFSPAEREVFGRASYCKPCMADAARERRRRAKTLRIERVA